MFIWYSGGRGREDPGAAFRPRWSRMAWTASAMGTAISHKGRLLNMNHIHFWCVLSRTELIFDQHLKLIKKGLDLRHRHFESGALLINRLINSLCYMAGGPTADLVKDLSAGPFFQNWNGQGLQPAEGARLSVLSSNDKLEHFFREFNLFAQWWATILIEKS